MAVREIKVVLTRGATIAFHLSIMTCPDVRMCPNTYGFCVEHCPDNSYTSNWLHDLLMLDLKQSVFVSS